MNLTDQSEITRQLYQPISYVTTYDNRSASWLASKVLTLIMSGTMDRSTSQLLTNQISPDNCVDLPISYVTTDKVASTYHDNSVSHCCQLHNDIHNYNKSTKVQNARR